jgi:hypothetical protein
MGQVGEQGVKVLGEPAIESPVAHPFNGMEHANPPQADQFARPQRSLSMFWNILHLVIYFAKQLGDKILSGHEVYPPLMFVHHQLGGTS